MTDSASTSNVSASGGLELAPRLGSFLEEYGEIATILPVLAGLFVTSRLQLRGAQALLMNLLIAAVARQVVLQLKQQSHASSVRAVNGHSAGSAHTSENVDRSNPENAEDYTIVHSTSGRLRLRIPRLLNDAVYAKRLEKLLVADARVMQVRFNRAAASVVILYDSAGVSELELGMRLLQILEQAEQEVSAVTADA